MPMKRGFDIISIPVALLMMLTVHCSLLTVHFLLEFTIPMKRGFDITHGWLKNRVF